MKPIVNTKILLYIFLLFFFFQSKAQNRWVDMFSYLHIQHIQAVGDKVYAQAENAFFIYDTNSGEIEKISSVNGLSGDKISNFYYHKNLKKLFVFHVGGLIEVIDEQQNVHRTPDLVMNSFVATNQKVLYNIAVRQNKLYLATGYGISVYDLERNEFNDTYYVGIGGSKEIVFAVGFHNNHIYAASNRGLLIAPVNANLIDFNVWQKFDNYAWSNLVVFNNKLIGSLYNQLYEIDGTTLHIINTYNNPIVELSSNNYLNVCLYQKAIVLNDSYVVENQFDNNFPNDSFLQMLTIDNKAIIATKRNGILKTAIDNNHFETIHPNCPLYNHPFGLDIKNQKLWVVYGNHTSAYNPWPLNEYGVSTYQNKQWTNIPYENINVTDLSYVRINPSNPDEVLITSANQGLLKFQNNTLVAHFDSQNSIIDNICPSGYPACARLFALDFDSENTLWITQSKSLYKVKPDNTWSKINISSVFSGSQNPHGSSEIVFDQEKNVWIGTEYVGVIGYNPTTGQVISINDGIATPNYTNVTALAIDQEGTMWMGNHEGLRIMPHPENAFTNSDAKFQPIKIVYEDVVQLLMEGQNISVIKVDGSNNKWFGTQGGGVYYFSEDGTNTIYHFNKENSPLPSNDIYDISIDGSTGLVYFATGNGLVAFKGNATDSGENLDDVYAFPNPVNMQQHNLVTIRGLMKGVSVKIVDVAGNLVYETIAKGGSIDWNLTAFGRYKVSSGVYIALITNDDGSITQTTKILIIK